MTSALARHQACVAAATSPSVGVRPVLREQAVARRCARGSRRARRRGCPPRARPASREQGRAGGRRRSRASREPAAPSGPPASRGRRRRSTAASGRRPSAGVGGEQGRGAEQGSGDAEAEAEGEGRAPPRRRPGGRRAASRGPRRRARPGSAEAAVRARPSAPQAQTAQASSPAAAGRGPRARRCPPSAGRRRACRPSPGASGSAPRARTAISAMAAAVARVDASTCRSSVVGDGCTLKQANARKRKYTRGSRLSDGGGAMRWQQLFADLQAQFEEEEAAAERSESASRARAEMGAVRLSRAAARRAGLAGLGHLPGRGAGRRRAGRRGHRTGCCSRTTRGRQNLVATAAVRAVGGPRPADGRRRSRPGAVRGCWTCAGRCGRWRATARPSRWSSTTGAC